MKDYKQVSDILDDFAINYTSNNFVDFNTIQEVSLSKEFKDDLNFSLSQISNQDKEYFVRDFIVAPMIFKTWRTHPKLAVFSHPFLKSDALQFYPDFLFTARHPRGYKELYKPLLVTVEAEHEEFTDGWNLALLQMIASQQINKDKTIPIFAVISNGKYWEFGKLENDLFTKNLNSMSISEPEKVLAVLSYLASEAEKYA
jgi:hypothetical protein